MEMSILMFGLAAAVCWGAADFNGGFATKHSGVMMVAIISQACGLVLLIGAALTFSETIPVTSDILWGASAGLAGGLGVLALYHALSVQKMGTVAPITAVISAIVPTLFGMITEGLPTTDQLTGFLFAFLGVWLISRNGDSSKIELQKLKLPLLSGLGFGLFMILIDQVQAEGILWPLVGARMASITAFIIVASFMKQTKLPELRYLPIILLAGFFDTGGNVFYVLAAKAGRLDVAAILTSMYPAITVLLAWKILKEKLSKKQWTGIFAIMVAVVLIA